MNAVLKPQIELQPFSEWMMDQVLELAREMHAESASHNDVPMNEQKMISQLKTPITNPDIYVRFAVRSGEVIGVFFGMVTSLFFSDQRAATDKAWFVRKSRRGSYAAVLLVRDFERWAIQRGATKFFLGQSTGVQMDLTQQLYEALGYTKVGVNTVKVI